LFLYRRLAGNIVMEVRFMSKKDVLEVKVRIYKGDLKDVVNEVKEYGSKDLRKLNSKKIAKIFAQNLIDRFFSSSYLDLEDLELYV
jgi:hypothetical protein